MFISFALVIIFGTFAGAVLVQRFREWGRCRSLARMDGKTVIITGSSGGIGKATAIGLAKRGARVIMACRPSEKANAAHLEVMEESGSSNVVLRELDLASLKSVREFAGEISRDEARLDVLINNAGIITQHRVETEDGFEMGFGVNHLGHFLLTLLLLDLLRRSAPSRVVNVSSGVQRYPKTKIHFDDIMLKESSFSPLVSYSQSKLANILFTRELAKQLLGTGITSYALHPGTIPTDIFRDITSHSRSLNFLNVVFTCLLPFRDFLRLTPEGASQTSIHCSVDEKAGEQTGLYYRNCAVKQPCQRARDDEAARKLWDLSIKLVGLE